MDVYEFKVTATDSELNNSIKPEPKTHTEVLRWLGAVDDANPKTKELLLKINPTNSEITRLRKYFRDYIRD